MLKAKILRSLEQFIQKVKSQNNFEFLVRCVGRKLHISTTPQNLRISAGAASENLVISEEEESDRGIMSPPFHLYSPKHGEETKQGKVNGASGGKGNF